MKYIISCIGKASNSDEFLITKKYLKRLKNVKINEFDVKNSNKKNQIFEEGLKLLNSTPPKGKTVLLDEQGDNLSSLELANLILNWQENNIQYLNFAIGGPEGNGINIRKKADKIIAFGKQTWPHQMVRMMIAEQIYRVETIFKGHPYHK